MKWKKIIGSLVSQIKDLKAGDGHITMNNIQHTKGLIGVVSVYDNIKPAHMVLDELYEWAEENNEKVMEMIEKFEKDMSWNERNPF